MEKILFRVFPVYSKSYSGFFRISSNAIPYSLMLTESLLILRFLGIPFIKINIHNIISLKYVGNEWVGMTYIFNGVVIKYKKDNGVIKERIISLFNKKIALEFFEILKKRI